MKNSPLTLLPLGIGNAFTSKYYHSSLLLLTDSFRFLIDIPSPFARVLGDASRKSGIPLTPEMMDYIYLTHLHSDHISGLEELAYWTKYVVKRGPINLLIRQEDTARLLDYRLAGSMGKPNPETGKLEVTVEEFFNLTALPEHSKTNLGLPELSIQTFPTVHSMIGQALKFSWRGKTFGYSADTEFSPELIGFLADSDLIVHEAGEAENHTFLHELLTLPPEFRAKLYITHIPDDLNVENSPIPALKEGALYPV